MKALEPTSIRPPFGQYSSGVSVAAPQQWVVTSGQLGVGPDDVAPQSVLEQARICFANCGAILAEAGLGPQDVVRVAGFVTAREDFAAYMQARDEWLADAPVKPTSTLLIVTGFTRAEFKVEVEVMAAR
ncbi:RidA family protein [Ketogulonicigenium vulgare]|nr:RidA family protein [Ketogulonicigenium vulgare]ADO43168.1 endoribonuclease L-PSP [Ketogulonicigenium vulgare Y25]ALJ81598.1 enamine deaminase RidA [Ketogulonicigenium vulgare]ANW35132.1 enamine deaminase RidA [Ketogulonicigenium vulgare]AOZ55206.1 Endoribonuclease L-PSP [Ketogulonicigenium vulgare]